LGIQVTLAPSIQMKIKDEGGVFESVSSGITFFIPVVKKNTYFGMRRV
jgi:hypothetical protein